jgi:hypothetical protein
MADGHDIEPAATSPIRPTLCSTALVGLAAAIKRNERGERKRLAIRGRRRLQDRPVKMAIHPFRQAACWPTSTYSRMQFRAGFAEDGDRRFLMACQHDP